MKYGRYRTAEGAEIDLDALAADNKLSQTLGTPDVIAWIGKTLVSHREWSSFQDVAVMSIIPAVRVVARHNWQRHPIYKFQLDLVGQLGTRFGQLPGTNTPEFLSFYNRFAS